MDKRILTMLAGVALIGCGEKAREVKDAASAIEAVAAAAPTIEATQKEAEQFQADRRSKGDTIAMGYADLQKLLPSAPDGYKAEGEPGGESQSMAGFSMSQAEQTFTKPAGAEGNAPSIHVTLVDFGGTQAAYGMMALPMMMNISREDAHQRMRTLKMDTPHTWGSEEYNKDTRDSKVAAVTRYRYAITVEARNQAGDESALLKRIAEDIAKRFEGK